MGRKVVEMSEELGRGFKVLRVKDWNEMFESAKSRTYKIKCQAYMPNKFGLGYRRLVAHPNGPALYGAWCAVVCLLSRMSSPREGYLTDTGRASGYPLSALDVSLLVSMPEQIIAEMLSVCVSQAVGWLVVTSVKDTTRIPQGYHADTLPYPLPHQSLTKPNKEEAPLPPASASPPCASSAASENRTSGNGHFPEAEFGLFWTAYPRKTAKQAARKAFAKAVKVVNIDAMLAAVRAHAASRQWRDGVIPHAATWLNQARWDDDMKIPRSAADKIDWAKEAMR